MLCISGNTTVIRIQIYDSLDTTPMVISLSYSDADCRLQILDTIKIIYSRFRGSYERILEVKSIFIFSYNRPRFETWAVAVHSI